MVLNHWGEKEEYNLEAVSSETCQTKEHATWIISKRIRRHMQLEV